eukprot:5213174-Prymnesium_polylepis.1
MGGVGGTVGGGSTGGGGGGNGGDGAVMVPPPQMQHREVGLAEIHLHSRDERGKSSIRKRALQAGSNVYVFVCVRRRAEHLYMVHAICGSSCALKYPSRAVVRMAAALEVSVEQVAAAAEQEAAEVEPEEATRSCRRRRRSRAALGRRR